MKRIKLTQEKWALIDNEDRLLVNQYKFCAHKTRNGIFYADTSKPRFFSMHQLIMGFPKEGVIDHINHNGLDNRRANLRIVSKSTDLRNRRVFKNNLLGITGIRRVCVNRKGDMRYRVQFNRDGKMIYLGTFKSLFQARAVAKQFIMA